VTKLELQAFREKKKFKINSNFFAIGILISICLLATVSAVSLFATNMGIAWFYLDPNLYNTWPFLEPNMDNPWSDFGPNKADAVSFFDANLDNAWHGFKQIYKKVYASDADEFSRRDIWESYARFIETHNAQARLGQHSFTVEMQEHGDLTDTEFSAQRKGFSMNAFLISQQQPDKFARRFVFQQQINVTIPDKVDWRDKGYVNAIKDQGQCGSCWAFSSAAALEGQTFKKTGKLVSLSEQNLVDCATLKYGNQGCNGGTIDASFQYIRDNKGINSAASYPYTGRQGRCRFNRARVAATDTGFVDIATGNETALTQAIAMIGPISIAMDASKNSFIGSIRVVCM
jgi:cathepsin L